ncbi:MAG: hypothetical protein ACI9UK_000964 [Candidatus Krumholzibacteriia bacterium]|jgi:hypothetical protein
MKHNPILRVARPTDNLKAIADMYIAGLGLGVVGSFEDHEGFDGIIIGNPGDPYHLEFTSSSGHRAGRAPTLDNLLVYYYPEKEDWTECCQSMTAAGFQPVASFNPYWDDNGQTFEDLDGYRVVIQHSSWPR